MRHIFVTQEYAPELGGMARRHVELCRRFPADTLVSTAPLVYVLAARQPNGKYTLHLEEVHVTNTGHLEQDVEATTARFTNILEAWIRRYPGQYLWAHRRWKRQPDDTPHELREP